MLGADCAQSELRQSIAISYRTVAGGTTHQVDAAWQKLAGHNLEGATATDQQKPCRQPSLI